MSIVIDYASTDVDYHIPDLVAARDRGGARGAIVRAVYGRPVGAQAAMTKTPFIDPVAKRDRDLIRSTGLRYGAYLFLCYPRKGYYTPEPELQVKAFVDNVVLEPFVDMPPWVDVEEESDVLTGAEMLDWTKRAWRALDNHYGIHPGTYTSARVWRENLRGLDPGEMRAGPLWLAKPWPWPTRSTARLGEMPELVPETITVWGKTQWQLYQRQGDAIWFPGFPNTVDINRVNTTKQGAKGDQVSWIQDQLGITIDGDFGPITDQAIQDLQAKHKLTVDGIAGIGTFCALAWNKLGCS